MSRAARASLLAICLAACADDARRPETPPPQEPTLVITNVTVVDVDSGRLVPDRTVIVRGTRIAAVGEASLTPLPANAVVVDGSGRFLIPGLWDFHVHALFDPEAARTFLPRFVAAGVTGVRDMGGSLGVLRAVRWAMLAGTMVGPRLVAAGAVLDGPEPVDPSVSFAVGDSADASAALDSLVRAGADFVKVYTLLPREAYFVVLREAHRRGLQVVGHVPIGVSVREAVDSGQRTIEHLRDEVGQLCMSAADQSCSSLLDTLRARGTWLVPTLVVLRVKAILDDTSLVLDPRLQTMPDLVRSGWDGVRERARERPAGYWPERRARFFGDLELTGAAWRAGVPLLAGTDAGALYTYPGSSLHDELVQLVRAGLTPAAALRAATLGPAEFLGATDSLGTVAAGKVADLVLLDADPLADIGNTRRITAVVLNGRLLARPALDSLAASGASAARPTPRRDSTGVEGVR